MFHSCDKLTLVDLSKFQGKYLMDFIQCLVGLQI